MANELMVFDSPFDVDGNMVFDSPFMDAEASPVPTIVSIGTAGAFRSTDTAVPVAGTNFVQGDTMVVLVDADGRRVTQDPPTVTDGGNLTFTVLLGALQFGAVTVEVTTSGGTAPKSATLNPPVGKGTVKLAAGFFASGENSILDNYQGITPDIGNQIIFDLLTNPDGDAVSVSALAEFSTYGTATGPQTFAANIHSGGVWHDEAIITVDDLEGEGPGEPEEPYPPFIPFIGNGGKPKRKRKKRETPRPLSKLPKWAR